MAFLCVALLCAAGCSTVTVQSAADPAAVHKLDRLFILIDSRQVTDQELARSLVANFVVCSTNTTAQIRATAAGPLDLDGTVYDRQITAFHPDAVLVISKQEFVADAYGGYPSITYDASLYQPITKRKIWRASIVNKGSSDVMERRMRKMAESIINQLKLDGFL